LKNVTNLFLVFLTVKVELVQVVS